MTHTVHTHTYLVGPRREFERYTREHDLSVRDPHVTNVRQVADLANANGGQVIFLKGFERLNDWRAIYNRVIANSTAIRMRQGEAP